MSKICFVLVSVAVFAFLSGCAQKSQWGDSYPLDTQSYQVWGLDSEIHEFFYYSPSQGLVGYEGISKGANGDTDDTKIETKADLAKDGWNLVSGNFSPDGETVVTWTGNTEKPAKTKETIFLRSEGGVTVELTGEIDKTSTGKWEKMKE